MVKRCWQYAIPMLIFLAVLLCANGIVAYAQDEIEEFSTRYSEMIDRFANILVFLIDEISNALLRITKAMYSLMALVGLLMWATGFHYRTGRNLIISAVILSIFVECIYPII